MMSFVEMMRLFGEEAYEKLGEYLINPMEQENSF
jgi:hypothetical protein